MNCSNPKCEKAIINAIYYRYNKHKSQFLLCSDCFPGETYEWDDIIYDLLTLYPDFDIEYEGDMEHPSYLYYVNLLDTISRSYDSFREEIELLQAGEDDDDYTDKIIKVINKL